MHDFVLLFNNCSPIVGRVCPTATGDNGHPQSQKAILSHCQTWQHSLMKSDFVLLLEITMLSCSHEKKFCPPPDMRVTIFIHTVILLLDVTLTTHKSWERMFALHNIPKTDKRLALNACAAQCDGATSPHTTTMSHWRLARSLYYTVPLSDHSSRQYWSGRCGRYGLGGGRGWRERGRSRHRFVQQQWRYLCV